MQGTYLETDAVCFSNKFCTFRLRIKIKFLKEDYYV
jgi:hypothetical protein